MKIVVAPDSYKGSLSALEAAQAMRRGIAAADPAIDVELLPMADGGEGFTEAMIASLGGEIIRTEAHDPRGRKIGAFFGWLEGERTAVIETAAASGLNVVPEAERNLLVHSTYGTGELIRAALDRGAERLIIGLGGSGTNDGGIGMAQALGYRFADAAGRELAPFGTKWHGVASVSAEHADARLRGLEVIAACDVDAPLYGPRGASAVFGPQKGATPAMVGILDGVLRRLADCLDDGLGVDVRRLEGGGAAGGLGAGLVAFCGAELRRGIDVVLDACGFDARLAGADLLLTGEGRTDEQTAMGKTAAGIAVRAKRAGVPVVVLSGGLAGDWRSLHEAGVDALFSIAPGPASLNDALANAAGWLERSSEQLVRLYRLGRAAIVQA